MTGLLLATIATAGIAWLAVAMRIAWARSEPDVLLVIARPVGTPEHAESRLTADLLAGVIDPHQYQRSIARLATSDDALAVSR